jgi:hypothetical protein
MADDRDWATGWQANGPGHLPVMGHPDCRWCYGTGARSLTPYRYCFCVGQGGQQQTEPKQGVTDERSA